MQWQPGQAQAKRADKKAYPTKDLEIEFKSSID
jgi:hypothetical protein